MDHIVTGELPEAPQPEGLSVALHPFQRQSLHFALELERRWPGQRDVLWIELTNRHGETYFYSPVHGMLCLGVPWQERGGILAEEMVRRDPGPQPCPGRS